MISAMRRTTCGCISERSRVAGAGRVLLTITPVLRRQGDLRCQTHEVRGCTPGLVRASASPHQLSIRHLSAATIAAGHRGLWARDRQGPDDCGRSVVHQRGADVQLVRQWGDGLRSGADGE